MKPLKSFKSFNQIGPSSSSSRTWTLRRLSSWTVVVVVVVACVVDVVVVADVVVLKKTKAPRGLNRLWKSTRGSQTGKKAPCVIAAFIGPSEAPASGPRALSDVDPLSPLPLARSRRLSRRGLCAPCPPPRCRPSSTRGWTSCPRRTPCASAPRAGVRVRPSARAGWPRRRSR